MENAKELCVREAEVILFCPQRDPNFAGASGSQSRQVNGGIGTSDFPASSCTDLAKMTHFISGALSLLSFAPCRASIHFQNSMLRVPLILSTTVYLISPGYYWLQPSQGVAPFQGYCDMEREGGGWLMCATTQGGWHMATEIDAGGVPFGTDGYRSDCRNVPFNQVLYVAHPTAQPESGFVVPGEEETAWFSFNGNNALIASRSGWGGAVNSTWGAGISTKFTGHGRASKKTPGCVQTRANSACRYGKIIFDNFAI